VSARYGKRVGAVCIPVITLDSYQESASASHILEREDMIPRLAEHLRRTKKRFVLTTWLVWLCVCNCDSHERGHR
jgi:hypothetical protein